MARGPAPQGGSHEEGTASPTLSETLRGRDRGSFGTSEGNTETGDQKAKWREFFTETVAKQHYPVKKQLARQLQQMEAGCGGPRAGRRTPGSGPGLNAVKRGLYTQLQVSEEKPGPLRKARGSCRGTSNATSRQAAGDHLPERRRWDERHLWTAQPAGRSLPGHHRSRQSVRGAAGHDRSLCSQREEADWPLPRPGQVPEAADQSSPTNPTPGAAAAPGR